MSIPVDKKVTTLIKHFVFRCGFPKLDNCQGAVNACAEVVSHSGLLPTNQACPRRAGLIPQGTPPKALPPKALLQRPPTLNPPLHISPDSKIRPDYV